jgi:hypothetical protein
MITSGIVTSPVLGLGVMVRRRWKDPESLRLKATVGLMEIEAVEFAMRSSARSPTLRASCRCFRLATYQGEIPR